MSTSFRLNEQRRQWITKIQSSLGAVGISQTIDYALMALASGLTKLDKQYKLVMLDLDNTLTPYRQSSAASFVREFLPGVREKCKELKGKEVLLALVTNQRKADEAELSQHLGWVTRKLNLDCVRWERDVERMKPNPYMLRATVDGLGLYPSECLMVGDELGDEQAALRAGVDFQWAGEYFRKENDG